MLLFEIVLFATLITLTAFVRIDYFRNQKRRFIGYILHMFFFRNLYDDYDRIIAESSQ